MFPLYDENRSRTKPYVTWILIIVNVIVFIWQFNRGLLENSYASWLDIRTYGAIPNNIMNVDRLYTLLTSIFMHGGISHIVGNMLYLFIFGDNIEDRFGHIKYLVIYLVFGVIAGLTHSWFSIGDDLYIPTIGASGAISGVLGAYVLLYPRARVATIIFLGYFGRIIKIPSIFMLGFWFIMQFLYSFLDPYSNVAYWAHIGGFIIGFIVAIPFKISKTRKQRDW
jgi:membrane associated rhomboid family serine protease